MSGRFARSAFRALTAVCLVAAAAGAQEPSTSGGFPFDAVEVDTTASGSVCYRTDRHIVVEHRLLEQTGADFFARARAAGSCTADSLPGDYVLRDEWAAWFAALAGDVLILDSGTGPDIRYLILIDLATRQRLAELPYVDLEPGPNPMLLGLWNGYEVEEPPPGCPAPVGGLVPGVDSLFFLDIRTGQTRFGDSTRCAQRQ